MILSESSAGSRLALFGLLVVLWIAYLPALAGGFLWDDDAHLTPPELRSVHGLSRIWFEPYRIDASGRYAKGATQQYYPLLHSAFWLQDQLWGDRALGYHLFNLTLHSIAVCLVYFNLRKLRIPGAMLAAAIFALHPVQVESVAWITEQKNTLSAVFYLAGMLAYLQFDQSRRWSFYAAAMALFLLGLLSKTITATLPAALLVIFWWQRGRLSWRRDALPLMPLFVLGAVAGLFTAWVERTLIGAEGATFDLSYLQRILLAGRVVWFYLAKLFWPTNLTFIYPRWVLNPRELEQWIPAVAAAAATLVLFALRKRSRAPLAGWLFFVGTLFPVLGFFNVYPFKYSFVADHFQYLACLGIITLIAAGLATIVERFAQAPALRTVGCASLSVVLAVLTMHQAEMYSDPVTLYRTTIERNPNCWMAYLNLGNIVANNGQNLEAIDLYRQVLQIDPENAEAHGNIGNALAALGRLQEAIEEYQRALDLQPNLVTAQHNMALALFRFGDLSAAIAHYKNALRIRPDYADAHNGLANALVQAGKIQEAIAEYRLAVQCAPEHVLARNNLGVALAQSGRPQEAIEEFEICERIQPDFLDAYVNAMRANDQLHRTAEAKSAAHKALELAETQGRTEVVQEVQRWLTEEQSRNKADASSKPAAE